jgi:hypothetical protein
MKKKRRLRIDTNLYRDIDHSAYPKKTQRSKISPNEEQSRILRLPSAPKETKHSIPPIREEERERESLRVPTSKEREEEGRGVGVPGDKGAACLALCLPGQQERKQAILALPRLSVQTPDSAFCLCCAVCVFFFSVQIRCF